jgi:hypothetical protein
MVETNTEPTDTRTEVLTIEDLAPSSGIVRIDGESHDLANTRVFSLRRRAELQQLVKRVEELEATDAEQLTEDDETEYKKRLRQIAAIALPTATAVLGKLTDAQIGDIFVAFFAWAAKNDPRLGIMRKLSSGTPSPASSGSTAAIR